MKTPNYRRVNVPCVLCKKGTLAPNAVCFDCQEIYEAGKRQIERRKRGEADIMPYIYDRNFRPTQKLVTRFGFTPDGTMLNAGIELIGQITNLAKANLYDATRPHAPVLKGFPEFEEWEPLKCDLVYYELTADQAEGIRLLLKYIHQVATYHYKQGYQYGSSALMQLAEGSLTTESFDAKLHKATGGSEK